MDSQLETFYENKTRYYYVSVVGSDNKGYELITCFGKKNPYTQSIHKKYFLYHHDVHDAFWVIYRKKIKEGFDTIDKKKVNFLPKKFSLNRFDILSKELSV
jgi:hypothetical protein